MHMQFDIAFRNAINFSTFRIAYLCLNRSTFDTSLKFIFTN